MNEWHLVPLIRHGRVFIAEQEQEVLGSVQYMLDWEEPKRAYLYGVAMSQGCRGKGLGTAFLKETFRQLADAGIREVELTVAPENASAIKVYREKLGFTVTEFRKDEYGPGEDRVVMKLLLCTGTDIYATSRRRCRRYEGYRILAE